MEWSGPRGRHIIVCSRRAPPSPLPRLLCEAERLIALGLRRCRLCRVSRFGAFIRRGLCVCLLALWGFFSPGGAFRFFVLEVLPPLLCFYSCWRLRLFLSFDVGRCCWCSSFGALCLLPALACLSFGGCVWCLMFGALGFRGLLLALGCSSSSLSGCGLWSVFVL